MKFEVSFTHVIERRVTCEVEASSEEEAIKKAHDGDYDISDEEFAPEDGIEVKDFKAIRKLNEEK